MTDWYDCIEPGVRELVRLLRNNGVNTTCSCEHAMVVEADASVEDSLRSIYDLLVENGYGDFRAELTVYRRGDYSTQCCLRINLPLPDGSFAEK